jgi:DNA (cytosine-5)-methyltransferase 1
VSSITRKKPRAKRLKKRPLSLPSDIRNIIRNHTELAYTILRKTLVSSSALTGDEFSAEKTPSYAKRKYKLVDLFSGAGGFTLGFAETGMFESVLANDFNAYAAKTYNANFGDHCIHGDINDLLANAALRIPKADVVIGGPPCQGFSLLNKQRDVDPRKELWLAFLEVVERVKPIVFVMENVPELLSSMEFQKIKERAQALGYVVNSAVLNAADYGVPQRRRRAIVIASRLGLPHMPQPTHKDPQKERALFQVGLLSWETVERAIGDLPEPEGIDIRVGEVPAPLDLHFGRTPTKESLVRYRCIPEGGNRFDLQKKRPDLTPTCWIKKTSGGTDLFGRLWRDRPAFTIRTEFFKPEKGRYLHPRQHRPITHREAARLQSFPDSFTFLGTKTEVAKQIGNAVPPLLAKKVAEAVIEHLARR